ncbi:MAG: hypothetical protein ACJ747_06925 [Gaiellaceae bacterium]|jgi:hypothetical protein
MAKYDLLVDGERKARVKTEDEVRTWVARYRDEHAEDDPDATHVQVIEVRMLGGTIVPRDTFF